MNDQLKYLLISTVTNLNGSIINELKKHINLNTKVMYLRYKQPSNPVIVENVTKFYKCLGVNQIEYYDLEENKRIDIINALENCDVLHLGGGDTFEFSSRLINAQLADTLKTIIPTLKLVIGESAGGILLTDDPNTAKYFDANNTGIPIRGLDILSISFFPHSDELEFDLNTINHTNQAVSAICNSGGILISSNLEIKIIDEYCK